MSVCVCRTLNAKEKWKKKSSTSTNVHFCLCTNSAIATTAAAAAAAATTAVNRTWKTENTKQQTDNTSHTFIMHIYRWECFFSLCVSVVSILSLSPQSICCSLCSFARCIHISKPYNNISMRKLCVSCCSHTHLHPVTILELRPMVTYIYMYMLKRPNVSTHGIQSAFLYSYRYIVYICDNARASEWASESFNSMLFHAKSMCACIVYYLFLFLSCIFVFLLIETVWNSNFRTESVQYWAQNIAIHTVKPNNTHTKLYVSPS